MVNLEKFFSKVRTKIFNGRLSQSKVDGLNSIRVFFGKIAFPISSRFGSIGVRNFIKAKSCFYSIMQGSYFDAKILSSFFYGREIFSANSYGLTIGTMGISIVPAKYGSY